MLDVHLNWVSWYHFFIVEEGLLVILRDCMIFLSTFLNITRMSVNSFPLTARFWNSQPIKCFPLTYDLNCFWSRINRHLFINCKFFLKRFHVCCNLFCVSFSCNSMLCRGCSALHGVTPNEKNCNMKRNLNRI